MKYAMLKFNAEICSCAWNCPQLSATIMHLFLFYLHCLCKRYWRLIQSDGLTPILTPQVGHSSSGKPLGSSAFEISCAICVRTKRRLNRQRLSLSRWMSLSTLSTFTQKGLVCFLQWEGFKRNGSSVII